MYVNKLYYNNPREGGGGQTKLKEHDKQGRAICLREFPCCWSVKEYTAKKLSGDWLGRLQTVRQLPCDWSVAGYTATMPPCDCL